MNKPTELEILIDMLSNRFGSDSDRHYEIVFAEKHEESGHWTLEVKKVEGEQVKNETEDCN